MYFDMHFICYWRYPLCGYHEKSSHAQYNGANLITFGFTPLILNLKEIYNQISSHIKVQVKKIHHQISNGHL